VFEIEKAMRPSFPPDLKDVYVGRVVKKEENGRPVHGEVDAWRLSVMAC
jgi:hypothetical protein